MNFQKVLETINAIMRGINGPFKVATVGLIGGFYVVSTRNLKVIHELMESGSQHYLGGAVLICLVGGFIQQGYTMYLNNKNKG